MFDVTVLGSLNLDLVARTERLPAPGETVTGSAFHEFPGGKGLNQAVAASRSGASVAMVGAVGDDDAGRTLRRIAVENGIDAADISTVAGVASGRAMIGVDDQAENSIIVIPGANHHLPRLDLRPSRVVLAQLEIPIDIVVVAFHAARSSGSTTILNPAPATPLPAELLSLTDVAIPNEHEVELLGGVAALRSAGVGTVIVTRGADGVTITDDHGTRAFPARRVTTVDTTGAGDAFCGAFAARLAATQPFNECIEWAIVAGALATTVDGAVPSLPDASAIRAHLGGPAAR